jgi:hypothetical protein
MTAALDVLTRDNLHLSKVTNGENLLPVLPGGRARLTPDYLHT